MAVFLCCRRNASKFLWQKETGYCPLRGLIRIFQQAVLFFQNSTRFRSADVNVISFAATRKIWPFLWRSSRNSYSSNRRLLTCATNCLLTMECIKCRKNLIYPLKYVDHPTTFHETLKPSMPLPNFTKIGREIRKVGQKMFYACRKIKAFCQWGDFHKINARAWRLCQEVYRELHENLSDNSVRVLNG